MKYLKCLALIGFFIGIGLSIAFIIYGLITKYLHTIIPIAIALSFAAFVYFFSISLQRKIEVFRLKYKAYENTNLHLNEHEKTMRLFKYFIAQLPILFMDDKFGTFKKLESHNEKIVDSVIQLQGSLYTLRGLFFSKEAKKIMDKFLKTIDEFNKTIYDIIKLLDIGLAEDIKAYMNMISDIDNKLKKAYGNMTREFLNLQEAIFKEMKIH